MQTKKKRKKKCLRCKIQAAVPNDYFASSTESTTYHMNLQKGNDVFVYSEVIFFLHIYYIRLCVNKQTKTFSPSTSSFAYFLRFTRVKEWQLTFQSIQVQECADHVEKNLAIRSRNTKHGKGDAQTCCLSKRNLQGLRNSDNWTR